MDKKVKGKQSDKVANRDNSFGALMKNAAAAAEIEIAGFYSVECIGPDGNVKWTDSFPNAITQEGKVCSLNATLKASALTQVTYMGLMSATGYTTPPDNTNTAAKINTAASANGWNEVVSSVVAARGTPSWGTATGSGGNASLALATALSFSILAPLVIKGCFILIKDLAGVSPTSAVGNTAGAVYSAGLFTGGDKNVGVGDTLNVSFTSTLT